MIPTAPRRLQHREKDHGEVSIDVDARPVAAMGESYGAALALRWKTDEQRVDSVVAIAPYAVLSNAVLNIRHEYAHWFPQ